MRERQRTPTTRRRALTNTTTQHDVCRPDRERKRARNKDLASWSITPLEGFVVAVTANRRAGEQAELLRRRGAAVVHAPALTTRPDDALLAATDAVVAAQPEVVVITTGSGFRTWVEAAQTAGKDAAVLDVLRRAAIVARGPKAAAAVRAAGLEVEAVAEDERMAGVWRAVGDRQRVAVQVDGSGTAAGLPASALTVPVYRWAEAPDAPVLAAIEDALDGRIDAFTFTSAPAVHAVMGVADRAGLGDALRDAFAPGRVVAACIGPACAEAAVAAGISKPMWPQVGRLGLMVRLLGEHLRAVEFDGGRVQGTLVAVGSTTRRLPHREAAILRSLAQGGGTVVSRSELLRAAWPRAERRPGPHALETAIGRLRRRVPEARIVTVPRRGYLLAGR